MSFPLFWYGGFDHEKRHTDSTFPVQWNIGRVYLGSKARRQGLQLFHIPMDVLMVRFQTTCTDGRIVIDY